MDTLGAGCFAPLAALARQEGQRMHLQARVDAPDGSRSLRVDGWSAAAAWSELADSLAQELIERGALRLLDAIRKAQKTAVG